MDNYGNTRESIFDFGIDETAKEHLRESAKWGKFLAIVSFISFGLILLFALGALLLAQGAEQTGVFVGYTIVALLYFYPMWTLYKFSSLSKQAVNSYHHRYGAGRALIGFRRHYSGNDRCLSVHLFNITRILLFYHFTFDLDSRCQLAAIYCPFVRQQGKFLYLLNMAE